MAGSIPAASGRIFMSYRREETAYPAGWLYDRLADRFGSDQVFKDVDSIELGDDFMEVITRAVGACDVLLALIGREWLTITDALGRRRLNNPHDFVRLEIEAALTRKVRVIPILVDGASMPDAAELPKSLARLVRRQALELSPSRFASDTGRLLNVLERTLVEVRTEHDDAASLREPAEKPPAPSTTKDQEVPERQEQARTNSDDRGSASNSCHAAHGSTGHPAERTASSQHDRGSRGAGTAGGATEAEAEHPAISSCHARRESAAFGFGQAAGNEASRSLHTSADPGRGRCWGGADPGDRHHRYQLPDDIRIG
jgi:hypothetical protein